jgi:DNA-binding response OmpR family regulator
VAESDIFLARMYCEKLGKHGYEIDPCINGHDCIQKYHQSMRSPDQNTNPFDIILINEDIEQKSGIRIIDEILFFNPNQKFLVISSQKNVNHNVSAIAKPFSMYDLIQRLDKIASKLENPYLNN